MWCVCEGTVESAGSRTIGNQVDGARGEVGHLTVQLQVEAVALLVRDDQADGNAWPVPPLPY